MRKEIIGNATLYLGDCLEILPSLEADAVVSDPPYGIAYAHSGGGRAAPGARVAPKRNTAAIAGDDQPFDPAPLLRFPKVLLFGADHYKTKLPDGGAWICWDKHVGLGPNDSFVDAEFAWANFKVKRNVIRYLWKGVVCMKVGEDHGERYHPTTKPIGLMLRCLEFIPDAHTILDPYMGSGSTGVACMNLGRNFIGVEIEPKYFDIACERIQRAQQQQRMFA